MGFSLLPSHHKRLFRRKIPQYFCGSVFICVYLKETSNLKTFTKKPLLRFSEVEAPVKSLNHVEIKIDINRTIYTNINMEGASNYAVNELNCLIKTTSLLCEGIA